MAVDDSITGITPPPLAERLAALLRRLGARVRPAAAPGYRWRCQVCGRVNGGRAESCRRCSAPSRLSAADIERLRRNPEDPLARRVAPPEALLRAAVIMVPASALSFALLGLVSRGPAPLALVPGALALAAAVACARGLYARDGWWRHLYMVVATATLLLLAAAGPAVLLGALLRPDVLLLVATLVILALPRVRRLFAAEGPPS